MATLRLHDFARIDGLRVPPAWALESQCVCWISLALPIVVCVFSHFCSMIVPENRVATAPRDQEESMNSTASCAQNQPLSSVTFCTGQVLILHRVSFSFFSFFVSLRLFFFLLAFLFFFF